MRRRIMGAPWWISSATSLRSAGVNGARYDLEADCCASRACSTQSLALAVELLVQRLRKFVSKLLVIGGDVIGFLLPPGNVHGEKLLQVLAGEIEPGQVEAVRRGQVAD